MKIPIQELYSPSCLAKKIQSFAFVNVIAFCSTVMFYFIRTSIARALQNKLPCRKVLNFGGCSFLPRANSSHACNFSPPIAMQFSEKCNPGTRCTGKTADRKIARTLRVFKLSATVQFLHAYIFQIFHISLKHIAIASKKLYV